MEAKSKQPRKEKRSCSYREAYTNEFTCMKKSTKGDRYIFCAICRQDIGISHGGRHDIVKHLSNNKHITNEKAETSAVSLHKISKFFQKEDHRVINAETLFTNFLVEHNISIAVAEHAGPLFRKMFPDSAIAKQYSCSRTKTSHVITCLAKNDADLLTSKLKTQPFSIATDGSTDMDSVKLYPVLIKTFDDTSGEVACQLLSIRECKERSTGENIFKILDSELMARNIPWDNCVSFATDNASVMVGKHKGVATLIQRKNPKVYVVGCACHLMHLAAKKGCKCLRYQLDDLLVEIWYFIDKSQLRHKRIIELQIEHGQEVRKILKHVSTRWLSLERAVCRLLDYWDPLLCFFKEESCANRNLKPRNDVASTTKSTRAILTSSCGSAIVQKAKISSVSNGLVNPEKKAPGKSSLHLKRRMPSTSSATLSSPEKKRKLVSELIGTNKNLEKEDTSTTSNQVKGFDLNKYLFSQQVLAVKQKTYNRSKSKSNSESVKNKPRGSAKTNSSQTSGAKKQQNENKPTRIFNQLNDPNCRLYALFLKATLPCFNRSNEMLQRDEPQVHKIHDIILDQLSNILAKFIKAEILVGAKDITKLDFANEEHHKDKDEIFIGHDCRSFLSDNKEKLDTKQFYSNVKQFYIACCRYMTGNYPFNDELLLHARVLDISQRTKAKFSSVQYFAQRFDLIKDDQMDELESQFIQYQIDGNIVFDPEKRIDIQWNDIGKIENLFVNTKKYSLLVKVMKAALSIFRSNADCERVFSQVNKNKTKERSSMGSATLSSIITHKSAMLAKREVCHEATFSSEILKKAKQATKWALSSQVERRL